MSQWDYKIDQPMPGPFPFPNLRKGPGIEVGSRAFNLLPRFWAKKIVLLFRFSMAETNTFSKFLVCLHGECQIKMQFCGNTT